MQLRVPIEEGTDAERARAEELRKTLSRVVEGELAWSEPANIFDGQPATGYSTTPTSMTARIVPGDAFLIVVNPEQCQDDRCVDGSWELECPGIGELREVQLDVVVDLSTGDGAVQAELRGQSGVRNYVTMNGESTLPPTEVELSVSVKAELTSVTGQLRVSPNEPMPLEMTLWLQLTPKLEGGLRVGGDHFIWGDSLVASYWPLDGRVRDSE
jgi:hypothetical protein